MKTADVLSKLPAEVVADVEGIKGTYKKKRDDATWERFNEFRAEVRGFLNGVQACGIITDNEWRVLYNYITL